MPTRSMIYNKCQPIKDLGTKARERERMKDGLVAYCSFVYSALGLFQDRDIRVGVLPERKKS